MKMITNTPKDAVDKAIEREKKTKRMNLENIKPPMAVLIFDAKIQTWVKASIEHTIVADGATIINQGLDETFTLVPWSSLIGSPNNQIYKFVINDTIVGLTYFMDHYNHLAMDLDSLEVLPSYRDSAGRYKNIAGCLIASVALLAQQSTPVREVWILTQKENLIKMYFEKYGMSLKDDHYVKSTSENNASIITKYLIEPNNPLVYDNI